MDFKNNDDFRFSKSTGVSVTEDLSKRTREARQEMRKSVGIIMRMMIRMLMIIIMIMIMMIIMRMMIRMIKMLSQVYDGCKVKVKEVNMMLLINSNSSPCAVDQYEYIVISININIVLYIQRFMRHVKKVNPEKRCFLQYDKLYIDGKVFMFNETTGKVTTENDGDDDVDAVQRRGGHEGKVSQQKHGEVMANCSG